MTDTLIDVARKRVKLNKNTVLDYILIASYAYYIRYESLFDDTDFDKICSYALKEYDNLTSNYKNIVTRDCLNAGSLYNLKIDDYPPLLIYVAEEIIRHNHMEKTK